MRKLLESPSLVNLQLVADYLESAGVRVSMLNEYQGSSAVVPHGGLSVWAELWVREDVQYPRALELLDAYRRQQDSPALEQWRCVHCMEDNPGNFEFCWHCGKERGE
ncbi:DUF2007 domain-containing protein [Mangrovimicrobium sediminis]|uniref:DUF2007 domain-containing protein n=1 Tax=Mangrovimicrobium sediminis TaxID=2562682 RepID=A0A4Z0M9D9_9GAMM|nr:DUF2007 domain-containing protein [Haliea sp. SAOS-164]TGD76008.1 DUF2007 domain-containing protein [Haliea sp. SAOS-164]